MYGIHIQPAQLLLWEQIKYCYRFKTKKKHTLEKKTQGKKEEIKRKYRFVYTDESEIVKGLWFECFRFLYFAPRDEMKPKKLMFFQSKWWKIVGLHVNIIILFCIENMRFICQCHFVHSVIAIFFVVLSNFCHLSKYPFQWNDNKKEIPFKNVAANKTAKLSLICTHDGNN